MKKGNKIIYLFIFLLNLKYKGIYNKKIILGLLIFLISKIKNKKILLKNIEKKLYSYKLLDKIN